MRSGRLKQNDVLKLYEKLVIFLFWSAFEGNETSALWIGKYFILFLVDVVAEDAASYNLCSLISGFQNLVEHCKSTDCWSFTPEQIIEYIDAGGLSVYIPHDGANHTESDSDFRIAYERLLREVNVALHWDNSEFKLCRGEDFQSQYTYVARNLTPKLLEFKYKQHRLPVEGASGFSSSQGQPRNMTNFLKLLTSANVTADQLALHNGIGM